jgi:hypothetical protein
MVGYLGVSAIWDLELGSIEWERDPQIEDVRGWDEEGIGDWGRSSHWWSRRRSSRPLQILTAVAVAS